MRRSLAVIVVLAAAVVVTVIRLNLPEGRGETRQTALTLPAAHVAPLETVPLAAFVDVTQQAGIQFVHENGAYGDKLLPETMGGGCALRLR